MVGIQYCFSLAVCFKSFVQFLPNYMMICFRLSQILSRHVEIIIMEGILRVALSDTVPCFLVRYMPKSLVSYMSSFYLHFINFQHRMLHKKNISVT